MNIKNFTLIKRTHWNHLRFFLAHVHVFLKVIIFNSNVFKLQRDSSATLNVSPKTPISTEIGVFNFQKNPSFASKNLSWVNWSKRNWTCTFLKVFYEKWAQTDVSQEMCIPISKGLKHLTTVLGIFSLLSAISVIVSVSVLKMSPSPISILMFCYPSLFFSFYSPPILQLNSY